MAAIIKNIDKPNYCFECLFSIRVDNGHVACSRNIMAAPIEDGDAVPDYCPIFNYEDILANAEPLKEEKHESIRCNKRKTNGTGSL